LSKRGALIFGNDLPLFIKSLNMTSFKSIWFYKDYILGSVKREFQSKYRNSLFGAIWTVLNPLAMILVYMVVFSKVMNARLPGVDGTFSYGIYLCSGVLTWNLFAEIIGRSQSMFLDNANILKKLAFPRLCLPVIVVGSAFVNFSIIFSLFSIFLLLTDSFPGLVYLAVLPLITLLILFAIGLGMILGVLNVFFRDVGHFSGIFLQFWFWLTPVVYPISIIPDRFRALIAWNPMALIVQAFQAIFVQNQWPDWESLWLVFLLAIFFCLIGFKLFRQHAGDMVDEL
jgi:lipopolysaccharide transport system permease protein